MHVGTAKSIARNFTGRKVAVAIARAEPAGALRKFRSLDG